jgi:transposase-like protein
MTEDRMALVELLQKSGDGDFLRAVAEAVLQILMEADVEGVIGAGRHERSTERLNTPPIHASWITVTSAFSAVLRGSRNGGKYEP